MSEPIEKNELFDDETAVKRGPSLFGPIVLIALGVLFLLNNLGMLPPLNWGAALQLWPLLLVFIGVNIIVEQLPRPWGSLLSALVALIAVGAFGYVLIFGQSSDFVSRWTGTTADIQTDEVALSASGIDTAEIEIDFGAPSATVSGLADTADVFAGTVSYTGSLDFQADNRNGRAVISLSTQDGSFWNAANPANWGSVPPWELGINPRIPTDLTLDVGSGAVVFDLQELTLTDLTIDGGSGSLEAALPAGDYNVSYDAASGATRMTLPGNGRQQVELDGSSGSITLALPPGIPARVEIEKGSGSVNVASGRLTAVEVDDNGDGIWQTADYSPDASSGLLLQIDGGSGSVRIEDVSGR